MRPRIGDDMFLGGVHDSKAPLKFSAKVLVDGTHHLDERKLKSGGNTGTYIGAGAAVFFGILSALLTISGNTKDREIEGLKSNLSLQTSRFDSVLSANKTLKVQLDKTKQSLAAHLEKHPISTGASPDRHPSNQQSRLNHASTPKNIRD